VKVEKNEVAVEQKSSESKQNSLSYDFLKQGVLVQIDRDNT
jgi:hypothetical protein